ncbi:MAG: ABC transporter ATP-binding protein, partial [Caulobacteraceae bacterium]
MTMAAASPATSAQPAANLAVRVWRLYLIHRWKAVAVAGVCAVTAAALNGALVGLLQRAVDTLISVRGGGWGWAILPAILAVLSLARGLALIGQSTLINRIGNGVVADIQTALVGNFMRGDLARLRATHSGSFVSKVLFDAGLV